MSYGLSPYHSKPGLDLHENAGRLAILRAEGRRFLSSKVKPGESAPFDTNDFVLSRSQTLFQGLNGPLFTVGQQIARQVARQLEWGEWLGPERMEDLDWNFFCQEGTTEPTQALFTQEWHIGSFSPSGAAGLWLPDASLATIQFVTKKGLRGSAYCAYRPPFHSKAAIQSMADDPENEVIGFTGNVCIDFPENMFHRRQAVILPPGVVRCGFRIAS